MSKGFRLKGVGGRGEEGGVGVELLINSCHRGGGAGHERQKKGKNIGGSEGCPKRKKLIIIRSLEAPHPPSPPPLFVITGALFGRAENDGGFTHYYLVVQSDLEKGSCTYFFFLVRSSGIDNN